MIWDISLKFDISSAWDHSRVFTKVIVYMRSNSSYPGEISPQNR